MTKNNELPFEKITIGEFFTQAEKQFPVWQEITALSADNYATAKKNLARLKEKYKNKWNDIAELTLRNTEITFGLLSMQRKGIRICLITRTSMENRVFITPSRF